MSGTNNDPMPSESQDVESSSGAEPAESAGCTLGISWILGSLMMAIVGASLLSFVPSMLQKDVDVDSLLEQTFKEGVAPFGLVESGSQEFIKRALVLRLVQEGLDENRQIEREAWEAAAKLVEDLPDAGGSGDWGDWGKAKDWDEIDEQEEDPDAPKAILALEVEPGSVDPDELLLVQFEDVKQLIAAFKSGSMTRGFGDMGEVDSDEDVSRQLERWKKNASYAWQTTLMRDKVRWDGWEADFHIDRSFQVGGSWSDRMKLNLGLGERNLALYVRWPAGYVVTRKDVERVASSIRM